VVGLPHTATGSSTCTSVPTTATGQVSRCPVARLSMGIIIVGTSASANARGDRSARWASLSRPLRRHDALCLEEHVDDELLFLVEGEPNRFCQGSL
jgi:hypothetical protein